MASKCYAVVAFFKTDGTVDSYSEVPEKWLLDDGKKCWWPKEINAGPSIVKQVDPVYDSWTIHEVVVEYTGCISISFNRYLSII